MLQCIHEEGHSEELKYVLYVYHATSCKTQWEHKSKQKKTKSRVKVGLGNNSVLFFKECNLIILIINDQIS